MLCSESKPLIAGKGSVRWAGAAAPRGDVAVDDEPLTSLPPGKTRPTTEAFNAIVDALR